MLEPNQMRLIGESHNLLFLQLAHTKYSQKPFNLVNNLGISDNIEFVSLYAMYLRNKDRFTQNILIPG